MELTNTYKQRIQELAGIHMSKEIDDIDGKTKMSIYDFDGTLIDTPLPETGQAIWEKKTGQKWKGGWFANPESLNMNVFDIPIIPDVISSYKKEAADKNTLVVMLTGRLESLSSHVEAILDSHGLKFDDYLYNTGGETGDNKMMQLELILKYNPNIREIEMWDDRDLHIHRFQDWGNKLVINGYIDKFYINHVVNHRH